METIEQIAVFVDIENVINFCNELGLPIDLAEVLEKLQEEGKLIVRRSFGDINKALSALRRGSEADRVRRMLRDNLFQHEDIPYTNVFKNSADMRLAVEALTTAFTLPNITKFAVVSGDSDYVPLFQKLKEQSRSVIGITGSKDRTAVVYSRSCDSLYYFEDIHRTSVANFDVESAAAAKKTPTDPAVSENGGERAATVAPLKPGTAPAEPPEKKPAEVTVETPAVLTAAPIEKSAPAPVFDLPTLRDEYANLLVKAVRIIEQGGKSSALPMLPPQMRQLQPDFNYERADFSSFADLAKFAQERGLIRIESRGGDVYLRLPAEDEDFTQEISTAKYRQFLENRLKCPLPSYAHRLSICEEAFLQIGYNTNDGTGGDGIKLGYLANDVSDDLADKNINLAQQEVYKYLYSLYLARCFTVERLDANDFNPKIIGFNSQKNEWDDRFVAVQMRVMSQHANLRMYPSKLSQLFYGTEEKAMHVKQLLNSLNVKFEAQ